MSVINATLSAIESLLRTVEEHVRALAQPLSGGRFSRVGFVDGSYALDERRGVYVLALSAASILVDADRMEGVLKGSAKPYINFLAPKSYAESRASLHMSMFELLGALDLVRRGVEAVFLDGSYVSEMTVPFGHPRDVYERFNLSYTEVCESALDRWGEASSRVALEAAVGQLPASLSELLGKVFSCSNELFNEICGRAPDMRSRKEALDFAVVYCETTAYLTLLHHFLTECEKRGVKPFWVAKDAESRYIVEREGVIGWLNDQSLLDHAWKNQESAYTILEGMTIHRPKPCALWASLLDEVYGRWGGYGVSYFKFGRAAAVNQMTFPHFVKREDVITALATLRALTDARGYPRPLSYVHHIAVLSPEFAKLIADELYKNESNPILKSMLAPSGRVMAGLR